ncbi:MAG: methyltransferase domain-containing protein [Rivularia sp. (in: Bacteria)]|nr:methyltransferase domain-containing protein [Rivularia sp. MS3]
MIESNNPEIDVDELMQKIREEVARRKNQIPQSFADSKSDTEKINFNFNYIEALIQNAETRASVRTKFPEKFNRFSFPLSDKIKQYCLKIINFIFKDQREVNLNLINALKQSTLLNRQLVAEIEVLQSKLDNQISNTDSHLVNIENLSKEKYHTLINTCTATQNAIESINETVKVINKQIKDLDTRVDVQEKGISKTKLNLSDFLEVSHHNYLSSAISLSNIPIEEHSKHDKEDLFYYLFENVFYNSNSVKEKQKYYLQYINPSLIDYPFLDAGCGRGEFISNLKSNQIKYQGIDINKLEIENLQQSGYEVYESDIIEFLQKSNDKYSGISSLQVVEHLNFEYLNNFIKLAFEKIVADGVIILETINPHSLYALSNFYQDPTHIKPLPPEMLQFLLEWHGFKEIKLIYSSLIPESLRIFAEPKMNYQDYALVGYKKL